MAPSQLPSRTLADPAEGEVRRRRPRRYRLEKPRRQLRKRDDKVDSGSEFSDGISSESEDEVVIPPPAQNQGGGGFLQPSPLPATPFIPALPFVPSPAAPAPSSTSSVQPPPPPPPSSSPLTTQQPPPPPETTSSAAADIRTLTARPHASVGNPFGGIGLDPNADPALNVQNPQETETETETDTDSTTSSPTSVVVVSTPDAVVPSISASITPILETVKSFSTTTVYPTETPLPVSDKEFGPKHDPDKIVQTKSDAAAEHVMIGGGSIGAFVGVCVLTWLVWRFTNARKKRGSTLTTTSDGSYGSPSKGSLSRQAQLGKLLGAIPWLRDRPFAQKWHALEDGQPNMSEKERENQRGQAGPEGFNFNFGVQQPSTSGSLGMPQLNTNVGQVPYATVEVSPVSSFGVSTSPSPYGNIDTMHPSNAPRPAVVASHQHQVSNASVEGQYGTWVYRTMPDGSASQPGTYDAQQRQAYRLSEISSLSSGFGDGDIIIQQSWQGQGLMAGAVAPAGTVPQPPPAAAAAVPQNARRSMSQATDAGWSRRDTVYTQTSEDLPPRFRNINSWVDQQKGRIQRAVTRAKDGGANPHGGVDDVVPPVPGLPAGTGPHGLPPEPQYNMMMPDGEVPRRVEM